MIPTIMGVLFCIVCVLLTIVILLQRGRGGGLSGAFGGIGGQTPFGAKTGDVFTWVTVVMTAIFLLLSILLNFLFVPEQWPGSDVDQNSPVGSPADIPALPSDQAQQQNEADPSQTGTGTEGTSSTTDPEN